MTLLDKEHEQEVLRLCRMAYREAMKQVKENLAMGMMGQGYGMAKSPYGGAAVRIACEPREPGDERPLIEAGSIEEGRLASGDDLLAQ